ncbi:hypothetical protein D1605_009315 [Xylella fastidiosa subsp. fastidiosa]|jgi:uncharacterized lipoprotein|uniref:Beta-barrel assembly machine subunit BamC n=2 Tax=Xylella fastidiosa TaxID=2371 RepID=Q87AT4_XYLFT|nr:hypothetical protein [Xylella fastidiosa]ADN62603.1 hypothetical protein XFLM_03020 [Xylella fastidiosa subsp. fastidiosa GB514]KAF0571452.1 hypothetical protein P305_04655 [Xylella fastidiosa subsp. fastidiosa Mus-1]AAO29572.1 conserved hypothetical protein [Xylella fastidiosa Temecula1]ACB93237.1 conserved hypothetical protein [Xylella fastidiosa M23]AIC13081.1 hypothetical protein P303_10000 [Xylella fastidiosa MUL0034]
MRFSVTTLHVYALVLLVVAALSGCTLLRKGVHKDYALSPETRPLEVPPDLNIPATSGEGKILPQVSSIPQEQVSDSISAKSGFTIAGDRDKVFINVGKALVDIPDVIISSKAQALGFYDVSYWDEKFLVRVARSGTGSAISVVDSRGMPATGKAAIQLIGLLKTKLAR